MNKQRINLTIDPDVFLWFKQKNMNMSNTVNEVLKNFMDADFMNDADEDKIMRQINEAREEVKKYNELIRRLSVELQVVRQNNMDEQKENLENAEFISRQVRHNNPFKNI